MGGSSKTKSKQATTTELPANQQQNIDQLMAGALDYYQSGGRTFFPGDTVANFDPNQITSQDLATNFAGGAGQDFANQAIASNQFFMDPSHIYNPDNVPGFSGAVDALTRGYTQNLTENILPVIRGGDTSSGQFGGSASGIGQALAAERSNQALGDSLSGLYLGAYGQGLNQFNQAMNRSPEMFNLGLQPANIYGNVGLQNQQQAQQEIQGERERHEFAQNEDALLLTLLQSLTGNAGQYGGTTVTEGTQKGGGGGGLSQGLGGMLSLYSLFSGMGGAGAGGGSQMPNFNYSDRRLKQNIRRIGTKSGYPWYSFTIFGQEFEGVMADEVPEEFTQKVGNYLMVDYSRIL
jgi:hypothetical protein